MIGKVKTKIACIGDIRYENARLIKETLFMVKQKYENLEIISGGRTIGAEKYVKKYALEFGIDYKEYNPAYTKHNMFSALKHDFYNKRFDVKLKFQRNSIMAIDVHAAIIFQSKNTDSDILHFIKCIESYGKPYKILK